jgi:hypothetical protein
MTIIKTLGYAGRAVFHIIPTAKLSEWYSTQTAIQAHLREFWDQATLEG